VTNLPRILRFNFGIWVQASHGCKANSNNLNPHLFEAANTQLPDKKKCKIKQDSRSIRSHRLI